MQKILCFLCLIFSAQVNAAITIPAASSIQSRACDGIVDVCRPPLLMHFDASAVTATITTKPFHDLEYRWNFGDAAAGLFSNGRQDAAAIRAKNLMYGPQAAHVYEAAGIYTARLTVTDASGTIETRLFTVVITDWPLDNKTVCVNVSSADFTGCPSGATQINAGGDWEATVNYLRSGTTCGGAICKRVLLQCGKTFTHSASVGFVAVTGPAMIDTYGSCGKATITGPNTAVTFGGVVSDVRIANILVTGNSTQLLSSTSTDAVLTNILFHRVDVLNSAAGISVDTSSAGVLPDIYGVTESSFIGAVGPGSSGIFVEAKRFVSMGNYFSGNAGAEQLLRMNTVQYSLACNNTFINIAATKEMIALRSRGNSTPWHGLTGDDAATKYVLLCNNDLTMNAGAFGAILFGPQDNGVLPFVLRDVINERNWIRFNGGGDGGILTSGSDVTTRYNIVDITSASTGSAVGDRGQFGTSTPPTQQYYYGNTVIRRDSGPFTGVFISVGATGSIAKNNLGYAPAATGTPLMIKDDSAAASLSNNTGDFGALTINPFSASTPITLRDLRIPATSYAAANGGATFPSRDAIYCTDIDTSRNRMGALVPEAWATCAGGKR